MSTQRAARLALPALSVALLAALGGEGLASPGSSDPAPVAAGKARLIGANGVDLDGTIHSLGTEPALHAVALVFLDTACPISNRYAPRLVELAGAASEAGLSIYGVLSDPALTLAEARAWRDEFGLTFPILFDTAGDLATRLAPTHVPEAFVVAKDDSLAYRGRIDDRFVAVGKLKAEIGSHDLADAITQVAAGEAPTAARTEPVGCVFEAWKDGFEGHPVTYTREVAPILNASCVVCHREGDIGPFTLTSFDDARRRAKMIAEVCDAKVMPPWQARPGYGSFRAERVLSKRERAVLRAWADAGAPLGDEAELLSTPQTSETRWRLGEPDLVVEMPVDYEVPADGVDIYRNFVVPSELLEDRTVVAVDFRPGDPSVVHHCLAYLDHDGQARKIDEATPEPGFSLFGNRADYDGSLGRAQFADSGSIAGWAPGNQPYRFPPGVGWVLPGGVDFVLEIHYHLTGKATTDRSALAFYFADEPVERYAETLVMGTERIDIPAGEETYGRYVWMELPAGIDVIDVTPHMHNLGREVEAFASLPNGEQRDLIHVPDWDFRWQDTYTYREPVHLPAGTRIEALFRYDNSAGNPFNPSSPPRRVLEGWQTTDEMCLFYFTIVPDDPKDVGALQRAARQSFMRPSDP
jgi:hypothetical protein